MLLLPLVLHSDRLRAVGLQISCLVRFEMPLMGKGETFSEEEGGGGLKLGKESQTLRERIELNHCFI